MTAAAALLEEFGTVKGFSIDHKVIKALLLNGATNAGITHEDGTPWKAVGSVGMKNGTQDIRIGWDRDLGTGLLNVSASLVNYNAGRMPPGKVDLVGWDLGSLAKEGDMNEYDFNNKLSSIYATLDWDRHVTLNDTNGDNLWQPGKTFSVKPLNDLDLLLWDLTKNMVVPGAYSTSDADSIEYFTANIPTGLLGDNFALRVPFVHDFAKDGAETYGLAWSASIPEPAALTLLFLGMACLAGSSKIFRRDSGRGGRATDLSRGGMTSATVRP